MVIPAREYGPRPDRWAADEAGMHRVERDRYVAFHKGLTGQVIRRKRMRFPLGMNVVCWFE